MPKGFDIESVRAKPNKWKHLNKKDWLRKEFI